jgi:hypothetical protein
LLHGIVYFSFFLQSILSVCRTEDSSANNTKSLYADMHLGPASWFKWDRLLDAEGQKLAILVSTDACRDQDQKDDVVHI